MTDDIELLKQWMDHPETVRVSLNSMMDEYMAEMPYAEMMRIQDILWSKDKP